MIVLDQARIDAPDFPRSAEWWQRFLPSYITAAHRDGGIVVLDVTGEAHPSQGRRPAALVRRNQYEAFLRWLHGLPQLEAAIVEDPGGRCQCWGQRAGLHSGHCCFMHDRICHSMPEDMRGQARVIPALIAS